MAFARREYVGTAPSTTLSTDITSSALSIGIVAGAGWPSGSVGTFYVVVDPGLSNEEKIIVTSRSGNVLTVAATADRGEDGTTPSSHLAGAVVQHVFVAKDADEANQHYSDPTLDHHTNYLTNGRHDKATRHTFGDGTTTAFGTPGAGVAVAAAGAAGTSGIPARSDHAHAIGTGIVNAAAIADGAVGADELATGAVTPGKMHADTAGGGIAFAFGVLVADVDDTTLVRTGGTGDQLGVKASGVAATQLASNAVTTAKILDANVTTAKILDANVTLAKLAAEVGAFTAYTPTLATWGLGNGTITGRYSLIGKTLTMTALLVVGSTTTFGTGPTFSLPGAYAWRDADVVSGTAKSLNLTTGGNHATDCIAPSTTTVRPKAGTDNGGDNLTSAVPFSWSAGDKLSITVVGEIA